MQKSESIAKLATALAVVQGKLKHAKKDSANPFFKSNLYKELAEELNEFLNSIVNSRKIKTRLIPDINLILDENLQDDFIYNSFIESEKELKEKKKQESDKMKASIKKKKEEQKQAFKKSSIFVKELVASKSLL